MRGEIKPLTGDQIQVVTSDQDNSLYVKVTNFEMEFYADAYKILDCFLGFYFLQFHFLNKLLNLIKNNVWACTFYLCTWRCKDSC